MNNKLFWLASTVTLLGIGFPVWCLSDSLSERGINALQLHKQPYNLLGRKISIGQVEIGRPGKFGLDKAANKQKGLSLAGSFYRNKRPKSDLNIDSHAVMVASIMISHDKRLTGIAPKARLYSSAIGSLKKVGQPEECLTAQHIAMQNGGDVRAINFSFGESLKRDPREDPILDGNALLTQCIDWSARVHETLYVVAGNQGNGGIPIPTDNYNGITTAYTAKRDDVFKKVDFANLSAIAIGAGRNLIRQETNFGDRRSISLLAPGNRIEVYNLEGKTELASGTSFAAPHITASVALLQEAGDRVLHAALSDQALHKKLDKDSPVLKVDKWTQDYRRHEVMKAILLNSADKIQDRGDGNLLGMSKTIFTKKNRTWLDSDAYFDPRVPLDIEMGTGHLNTMRAYKQLYAGQWSYQNSVPNQGWNYDTVSFNKPHEYAIAKPLKKNSFVSITLAWDRLVELNDGNNNKAYDVGEDFQNLGLNNLDVSLVSIDQKSSYNNCFSNSKVDSVEHIFCRVPEEGEYKIRVSFSEQINKNTQPYALAWHTLAANN